MQNSLQTYMWPTKNISGYPKISLFFIVTTTPNIGEHRQWCIIQSDYTRLHPGLLKMIFMKIADTILTLLTIPFNTHTHTDTHFLMAAHFPGESGLAGWPLDYKGCWSKLLYRWGTVPLTASKQWSFYRWQDAQLVNALKACVIVSPKLM